MLAKSGQSLRLKMLTGGQGKVGHKGSANQAVLAQFPPLITVNARLSCKMISWSEVC